MATNNSLTDLLNVRALQSGTSSYGKYGGNAQPWDQRWQNYINQPGQKVGDPNYQQNSWNQYQQNQSQTTKRGTANQSWPAANTGFQNTNTLTNLLNQGRGRAAGGGGGGNVGYGQAASSLMPSPVSTTGKGGTVVQPSGTLVGDPQTYPFYTPANPYQMGANGLPVGSVMTPQLANGDVDPAAIYDYYNKLNWGDINSNGGAGFTPTQAQLNQAMAMISRQNLGPDGNGSQGGTTQGNDPRDIMRYLRSGYTLTDVQRQQLQSALDAWRGGNPLTATSANGQLSFSPAASGGAASTSPTANPADKYLQTGVRGLNPTSAPLGLPGGFVQSQRPQAHTNTLSNLLNRNSIARTRQYIF